MTATVMVVDDDADLREALSMVLELEGVQAITACDGADALAKLRAGERPALILLDLMMPNMNGAEFRSAQQQDPALSGIPVVLISADELAASRVASLDLTCLRKPIDLTALRDVLHRYCDGAVA